MEEEGEGSSYITTSSLIDAQFHDLIQPEKESESSSTAGSRSKGAQKKQSKDRSDASVPSDDEENQDWEWVEETQYIILDFGGNNLDARDMEKMLDKGINLVGLDTPTPYFKSGVMAFKGFYDENAITEDLIFDMKAREAREEQEEGMEESDEESSEALDLLTIATKRIIFEAVDLIPKAELQEERRSGILPISTLDREPAKGSSSTQTTQPPSAKPETKMSIWKAAYDAVGLERVRRSQPVRSKPQPRGKRVIKRKNKAGTSSSAPDPDNAPAPEPPEGGNGGDIDME